MPPGGSGLYYFSLYITVDSGEYGKFAVIKGGATWLCLAQGYTKEGGAAYDTGTCSVTVELTEGDTIQVLYNSGTDETPLSGPVRNGFTGFRIPKN